MTDRMGIGGNNPPEDEKITQLSTAEEVKLIIAGTVSELKEQAAELLDTCKRVPETISNDDIYDRVVALIAALRETDSTRDEKRKKFKEPYLSAGQIIDSEFKLKDKDGNELAKKLEAEIKNLTAKLSIYDTKKFEEQRQAAEKEAALLAEQASKDGISVPANQVDIKLESRRSEHGGLSTKTVVKEWEVTDESLLPRSVLSIDPKKVQALVDKGAEIPGIKITERIETTVKRK